MKTSTRFRRLLLLPAVVFALGATLVSSGCVAVAVGAGAAGAVAWYKGELKANLSQSVPAVNSATERAVDQLKLFLISKNTDQLTGSFTLRNAKDEKITINVEKSGDGITQVRIRVGVLGDEAQARSILDQIKSNL